jgi:hypothetical protein
MRPSVKKAAPAGWGYVLTGVDGIRMESVGADGWRPSQLLTVFSRFNTSGLHFLYNLPRPNSLETHEMIRIYQSSASLPDTASKHPRSTSLCTTSKCSFKQLQDHTYQTKHVH